jgi:hypothetical protein
MEAGGVGGFPLMRDEAAHEWGTRFRADGGCGKNKMQKP